MPLWKASTQPCRAMKTKTNEISKSLLKSAGLVAKLAIKKRIIGLRIRLVDHNTTTTKHLHSHQDRSSQVRKTKAGTTLKVDME